jgi:predicted ATP-dependent endonuclease of OLD family
MFKIKKIFIEGFWQKLKVNLDLNDNVNIIIGRNGTGKTTFMNLLHSALTVDTDGLIENEFKFMEIKLSYKNQQKTIKIEKIFNKNDELYYDFIYTISRKSYHIRTVQFNKNRFSPSMKKRLLEQSNEIKHILEEYISLSSLSVYRLRSNDEIEINYRHTNKIISPVDYRLNQLENDLTKYQLELSKKAREISSNLQKEVLSSILYSKNKKNVELNIPKDFNKKVEKARLTSAYKRLGVFDSEIKRNIEIHIDSVDEAVKKLFDNEDDVDYTALEAYFKTQSIIDMSLDADGKVNDVFCSITLFLEILKEFIIDKDFSIEIGGLKVFNKFKELIPIDKLSSGEKQLLILFIETLLQKSEPYIYLTDEPELSLHIDWQRRIIPAIKKLNPSSQIIAATHSPEVASKYKNFIIDMEDTYIE